MTTTAGPRPDGRIRVRRRRRTWVQRHRGGLITLAVVVVLLVAGVGAQVLRWDSGLPRTGLAAIPRATATSTPSASAGGATPSSSPAAAAVSLRGKVTAVADDTHWTFLGRNGTRYDVVVTDATTFAAGLARTPAVGDTLRLTGTATAGTLTVSAVAAS